MGNISSDSIDWRYVMGRPGFSRLFWLAILLMIVTAAVVLWIVLRHRAQDIRNVILISIDTCRSDYLSCYGYPRQTTPNIDRLADQGVLFENTISPVPITLPAHSTMMTGTIPPYHGVRNNIGYQLSQPNQTLAEMLSTEGFRTAAIVSAFVLDSRFGMAQGFESYNDRFVNVRHALSGDERIGQETTRFALEWLDEHKSEKFFLFLHYYDPHDDYEAPEPFATEYADNPYAGEIAYTDHCIGRVIEKIKEIGLYDSSLIIITSDHGEMLGEHGELTHTYFVYKSAVKVPLIFKLPGRTNSRRVPDCVGLVDILPTICRILGIDRPEKIQGRDLSPYFKGKPPLDKNRSLYSESIVPTRYGANTLMALTTDRYKYIQSIRPELYDIVQDPNEQNNLFEKLTERGAAFERQLQQVLEQTLAKDIASNQMGLTAQDLYRLESLGYVGGTNDQGLFDPNQDDAKDLIDFHVSFKQALIYEHKGQYEQCKQILRKLSLERPTFPETFAKLAKIAFQEQKFQEALEPFYALIKLNPNDSDAEANLGITLANLGRLDDAIIHLNKAIQIDPTNSPAHHSLASLLQKQGKPDQALVNYNKAVELGLQTAQIYYDLAGLWSAKGDLDKALSYYFKSLQVNPRDTKAHNLVAAIFFRQRKWNDAVKHYETSLKIKPDQITALNNISWICSTKLNDPDKARELALQACKLGNYSQPAALDTLAIAYAASGDFDLAVETVQKAITLAGDRVDKDIIQDMRKRLDLYQNKQPYR
jgi:arylsulfatase A-like enzyme/Flp pilus assembly protein TadD